MTTSYVNGVVFAPVSNGTVDFVVSSAVTGWQTPASGGAVDGATYRYRAAAADGSQWEIGTGTYTVSTTTLARTTVSYNSLGTTAKVAFTLPPQVSLTVFAADLDTSGTYVAVVEEFVGANTASITTTNTIASKDSTLLIVGGVPQPSSAWTLSGNTITLANSEVFATGESINVRIMKGAVSYLGVNPLYARHTGTGSAGPFTLLATPIVFNALDITVGNVLQPKDSSAYTLSGNQITFTEAVPVGTYWDELILQPLGISTVADGTVTNTKMATMGAHTYKGNNTGSSATPADVTAAQVLTDVLSGSPLAGFRNKIINGNFGINQLGVSGTVTLAAGIYGHDQWKAGASGCTYTFSTVANVTTITISAGSLLQPIEGLNLMSGTHILSWVGTAQGKIGAGSFSASGVTGTAVGGTNLNIEFGTGTLSMVQFEPGSVITPFEQRFYSSELDLCQRYLVTFNPTIAVIGVTDSIVIPLFFSPMRASPSGTFPYTDANFTTAGSPSGSTWNLQRPNVVTVSKTGTATIAFAASSLNSAMIMMYGMTFSGSSTYLSAGPSNGNIILKSQL